MTVPQPVNVCKTTIYNCIIFALRGYKHQKAFNITQGPTQCTAREFWKMVFDRKCEVIVMLSNLVEGGEVRIIAT